MTDTEKALAVIGYCEKYVTRWGNLGAEAVATLLELAEAAITQEQLGDHVYDGARIAVKDAIRALAQLEDGDE